MFKNKKVIDVEVDVDIDRYVGCLKGVSKSVQLLSNGIEAVIVLTLIILKWSALYELQSIPGMLGHVKEGRGIQNQKNIVGPAEVLT